MKLWALIKWFILLAALAVVVTGSYLAFLQWYWYPRLQKNLDVGLAGLSYQQVISTINPQGQHEVFGFLPYWTMADATVPPEVTDVAYFAVSFNGQGQLIERAAEGYLESGYAKLLSDDFNEWLSEQHAAGKRVHITVVGQSGEDIANLVVSPSARQQFGTHIRQLLVSYPFDGLQLDFEIAGNTSPAVQQGLVDLSRELQLQLSEIDEDLIYSVAVFGTAASNDQDFWNIAALDPYVDRFIIMSYDYHVRSSDVAGPVAPLFGKETGRYQDDITSNLRDFLQQTQPEKVLLGVPFYGYQWQVTQSEPGASTFPRTGSTATYQRVQELLQDEELSVDEGWDAAALTPYVQFRENGQNYLIYYDNPRSLSYKMDLVNQMQLKGIAIWALGYEGDLSELWEVIDRKITL